MNKSAKKVLGMYISQLGLFSVIAVALGANEGWKVGLQFMALELLAQAICAPFCYAYFQRKARIEALEFAEQKRKAQERAPLRAAIREYFNDRVPQDDALPKSVL